MATSATASVLSSLATALGSLTPGALRALGNHLSASQQISAAEDLDEATPANIATQKAAIQSIVGTSAPAVITALDTAVKAASSTPPDQARFDSAIDAAQAALTAAATNTGVLGNLF